MIIQDLKDAIEVLPDDMDVVMRRNTGEKSVSVDSWSINWVEDDCDRKSYEFILTEE